jgi:hypothetical protein
MYSINLSSEEQEALRQVLECSISDLHSQIVRTDRYDFKRMLIERKKVLLGLLNSLQEDRAVGFVS